MSSSTAPRRGFRQQYARTLVALPFALMLALGLSSQRVGTYWWDAAPRDRIEVVADGRASLTNHYEDAQGWHDARVRLRVVDTRRVTSEVLDHPGAQPRAVTVPAGQSLWRLTLRVEAEPTAYIRCQGEIRDAAGRPYSPGLQMFETGTSTLDLCDSIESPGPGIAVTKDSTPAPEDLRRPPAYDRYVYVSMPASASPARLVVWFTPPDAAFFELSPAG
ncbi:MAG: hypothetical protein LWW86_01130 [Micrococcales bacterium]|nr:hypothetical protein [Micrococcales bacterium]